MGQIHTLILWWIRHVDKETRQALSGCTCLVYKRCLDVILLLYTLMHLSNIMNSWHARMTMNINIRRRRSLPGALTVRDVTWCSLPLSIPKIQLLFTHHRGIAITQDRVRHQTDVIKSIVQFHSQSCPSSISLIIRYSPFQKHKRKMIYKFQEIVRSRNCFSSNPGSQPLYFSDEKRFPQVERMKTFRNKLS